MSARPFAAILDSLTRQRWVTAALVVSERDGIVVESNLQIGQSGDRVAALAGSLYRKARLSARAAGLGAVLGARGTVPHGLPRRDHVEPYAEAEPMGAGPAHRAHVRRRRPAPPR